MKFGRVTLLLTAEAAGQPMQRHERVEVEPGLGIPGDRYATRQGHWSDPRWPDQELTLVAAELAAKLDIEPTLLRRNVVTTGVELEDLLGREFSLGTATLRGVRTCDPCKYLEGITRAGLFAQLDGRGGIRVAVIHGGTISVGDELIDLGVSAEVRGV